MMSENELLLEELKVVLKEKQFDEESCQYFLETFKSLEYNYDEYLNLKPEIADYPIFAKRYIDIIKNVKKFTILKDINENDKFLKEMKPAKGIVQSIGYNKDENDNFFVSRDNPQYYCTLFGLTNNQNGEVTILFDELTKQHRLFMMVALIHELTHAYQIGFYLPWYVMNRKNFARCLREGHAMTESQYVTKNRPRLSAIPFNFNEAKSIFENPKNNEYNIYKYIYFKLEILLGYDFMDKWATNGHDIMFLSKVRKLIDKKYGSGTFKKLYEKIEIILFSLDDFSVAKMETIIDEMKTITCLYSEIKDDNQELSLNEYFKLSGNAEAIQEQLEVSMDIKQFKLMTASNVAVCNEAINNPNYLTEAIINLELLILKCLSKDMKAQLKTGYIDYMKYNYYLSNIKSDKYNYKIMENIKNMLVFMSVRTYFHTPNEIISEEENNFHK